MGSYHSYSYDSAKFVGFAPGESEDKIFLSRDHVVDVSRDFVS